MDVFLSSALKCVGFSNGQPRIHQGNQIHVFGCPAFKIGTTWIFFKFRALVVHVNFRLINHKIVMIRTLKIMWFLIITICVYRDVFTVQGYSSLQLSRIC